MRLALAFLCATCLLAQNYTSYNGVPVERASYLRKQLMTRAPNGVFGDVSLVAYYPLTEGQGRTGLDLSASWGANAVASNGAAAYSSGKTGPYAASCLSTVYLTTASATGLATGNAARTLSAWFQRTSDTGSYYGIASYGSSANNGLFGLVLVGAVSAGGGGARTIIIDDEYASTPFVLTQVAVTDTNWHYLAAVADGSSNIIVYLDGASVYSGTHTWATGTGKITVCADYTLYTLPGSVNNVRIYSRALSAPEIAAIYAAQKGY